MPKSPQYSWQCGRNSREKYKNEKYASLQENYCFTLIGIDTLRRYGSQAKQIISFIGKRWAAKHKDPQEVAYPRETLGIAIQIGNPLTMLFSLFWFNFFQWSSASLKLILLLLLVVLLLVPLLLLLLIIIIGKRFCIFPHCTKYNGKWPLICMWISGKLKCDEWILWTDIMIVFILHPITLQAFDCSTMITSFAVDQWSAVNAFLPLSTITREAMPLHMCSDSF